MYNFKVEESDRLKILPRSSSSCANKRRNPKQNSFQNEKNPPKAVKQ
jgi:hypothetical protein